MSVNERGFTPPDGGYGWIVIIACVIVNSCLMPLTQCFGLIYENEFHKLHISAAQISFLLHLNNSIMCGLGLFSGPLLKKYNFRQVSFIGASLVCLGIFLTVFAHSYGALIFTISILIGTGQGVLMPATYVAVNSYFKKKLTLAVSLQVAGVSLSPIVVPYIIIFLLDNYGTRGTVLILAGISLNAIPAIVLLRPIKTKPIEKPDVVNEEPNGANKDVEANSALLRQNSLVYKETTTPKSKEPIYKEIFKIFNFKLLLDKGYVIIIIGMGISFASELNIVVMMPFILEEFARFPTVDVGLAMSLQAAADILGRLLIPILAHKSGWSAKLMYGFSLIGSSVGRTILAIFWDVRNVVLFSTVIIGLSKGAKAVFQSLIIPKYVTFEDLAAATGLNMVTTGILSLIIGPIIGLTHDITSSYNITLHIASILSLLCVLLWVIADVVTPKVKENKLEINEETKD